MSVRNSRAEVERRRKEILAIVEECGEITQAALARRLGVTVQTIKRDSEYLDKKALLERIYGGVRKKADQNNGGGDQVGEVSICRKRIAEYAASLVEDGDCIFINTSSTALQMLPLIRKRDVTVITNNGNAINTPHTSEVTVILTGGELRYQKGSMVGDFALGTLSGVIAKKCFMGCSGFSLESGMTTEHANEVNINEMMFARVSGRAYILADHRKIGKNSSFVSCPANHVTDVITDTNVSELMAGRFKKSGIRLHRV